MTLDKYIKIMYENTKIHIIDDKKEVFSGTLSAFQEIQDAYLEREVQFVSGQADVDGVKFFLAQK